MHQQQQAAGDSGIIATGLAATRAALRFLFMGAYKQGRGVCDNERYQQYALVGRPAWEHTLLPACVHVCLPACLPE